jgi:beta-barrel assembly-enhancing protease
MTSRFWFLLALAGLFISIRLPAAPIQLPDMGGSASNVFSPELDRRIGAAFMRQVRRQMNVIDDPEMQAYVRSMGLKLASNSSNAELRFKFFLVDSPSINAFAGPGGNIAIHSGLVKITESESELASVFAHEISHVTQRHLPRAFERQSQLSKPTLAAMVGALILTAVNPQAGQAALLAVQGGAAQMQIDFTRANEEEADRVGVQLLQHAGYDPHAMPGFFSRMAEASKYSRGKDIPEFLLTHPVTARRISEAQARVAQLPRSDYQDSLSYLHFATRVRATLGNNLPDKVINDFSTALAEGEFNDEAAHRYGYAYALMRGNQLSSADTQSQWLLERAPHYMPYRVLEIRLQLARKNHTSALRLIDQALTLFPGNDTLLLLQGETLLLLGQPERAAVVVDEYLARNSETPIGYQLQARIAAARGRIITAYQMEAEYHYWGGGLAQGIEALREAARQDNLDFITLSKIENRLRFFQSELAAEREIFGG